jgi:hypothetical protein
MRILVGTAPRVYPQCVGITRKRYQLPKCPLKIDKEASMLIHICGAVLTFSNCSSPSHSHVIFLGQINIGRKHFQPFSQLSLLFIACQIVALVLILRYGRDHSIYHRQLRRKAPQACPHLLHPRVRKQVQPFLTTASSERQGPFVNIPLWSYVHW